MRLVHLSDTHLGYSDYSKTNPKSGINQREADIYSVFNEIIEYILKTKPNLVIHSGDLFDSIRPSNRAIYEAFRQIYRLSLARIPTVIIAGNHSTPRQKSTSSIFHLFEHLEHIHPVFEGEYNMIEIGDAKIHAIPHPYNEEMFKENFNKLKVDKKFQYNILVTHATVIGIKGFTGPEFKELAIPRSALSKEFDYIALGHLHGFIKVANNAYYAGAPERMGFGESRDKKGFLDVTLGNLQVKRIETSAREVIDIKPVDCSNIDATQIVREIEKLVPADISGKIMRLVFKDIAPHVYASLDFRKIDELTSTALHCKIEYEQKSAIGNSETISSIGALGEEFVSFIRKHQSDNSLREELEKRGMEYLGDALQTVDN